MAIKVGEAPGQNTSLYVPSGYLSKDLKAPKIKIWPPCICSVLKASSFKGK